MPDDLLLEGWGAPLGAESTCPLLAALNTEEVASEEHLMQRGTRVNGQREPVNARPSPPAIVPSARPPSDH